MWKGFYNFLYFPLIYYENGQTPYEMRKSLPFYTIKGTLYFCESARVDIFPTYRNTCITWLIQVRQYIG